MENKINSGATLDITASEAITSGRGVLVGLRVGVALTDIANGAVGTVAMKGVFNMPKLTTDVVAQGVLLYWDNTNKRLTVTSAGNTLAGYATAAAGNGVTTVNIALNA
jgi:predicted RecA/RadA family phage recombinase